MPWCDHCGCDHPSLNEYGKIVKENGDEIAKVARAVQAAVAKTIQPHQSIVHAIIFTEVLAQTVVFVAKNLEDALGGSSKKAGAAIEHAVNAAFHVLNEEKASGESHSVPIDIPNIDQSASLEDIAAWMDAAAERKNAKLN